MKKGLRVLVCGDRDWLNKKSIRRRMMQVHRNEGISIIIEGECRGADLLSKAIAKEMGIPVKKFKVESWEWKKFGRAAGPIRNQRMIEEGEPDLVLAFHPNLEQSKGTKDMVARARNHGIRVKVFDK